MGLCDFLLQNWQADSSWALGLDFLHARDTVFYILYVASSVWLKAYVTSSSLNQRIFNLLLPEHFASLS